MSNEIAVSSHNRYLLAINKAVAPENFCFHTNWIYASWNHLMLVKWILLNAYLGWERDKVFVADQSYAGSFRWVGNTTTCYKPSTEMLTSWPRCLWWWVRTIGYFRSWGTYAIPVATSISESGSIAMVVASELASLIVDLKQGRQCWSFSARCAPNHFSPPPRSGSGSSCATHHATKCIVHVKTRRGNNRMIDRRNTNNTDRYVWI